MLESLRASSQTLGGRLFLTFLFGLLALAFFITFGPSGRAFDPSKGGDYAAKVNGEQITRNEFERYYYRQIRQFGQVDPAMIDRIMPRSRVLDEMIKDRLVAESALQEGIDVSDKELRDFILKDPSFEQDGKFSPEQYRLVVERSLGITPDQYEDDLRRALRSQKMAALLRETAKVSDEQLKQRFAEENEKIDLSYVRFSPAFYTSAVKVTDDEVKALLKDHLDQVQAAYTKQTALYHTPKQIQARHILIKVPGGNPAADKVAEGRLAKIKADVEKGGDFAAIAKTQSQAGDAPKGGDLGIIRAGGHGFDPAIEEAAVALDEGKISDPVRSKQGWELVQALKVIPATDHALDEVKDQVARDVIVKERALAAAEAAAKAAQAALASGKSLAELFPPSAKPATDSPAAPAPDHPVSDSTGPFARSAMGFLPKIGPAPELQKAAFDGAVGKALAGPTRVGDTFVVAVVSTHEKPDAAAFEKQKDDLRENELRRQEVQLMQSLRQKLRSQAVVEINGAVLGPSAQQG